MSDPVQTSEVSQLTEYMQRAGHVILDGVVDPTSWVSYKVISMGP
jgi:hypothetical protein